jgi:two-component system KDP operon response regulator KdpE
VTDETLPRVLVADDEPYLLKLMQRVLAGHGFPVVGAPDGDAAVQAFETAGAPAVEAVVLDVTMPPRGAFDALERMLARKADLAVVLTSGAGLESDGRDRLESRRGVFLQKPFAPEALVVAVNEALAARLAD